MSACSCSAHMTARNGIRYQLDPGCKAHSPSPALVAHARAVECPCVTISGGRAYPRPGCGDCSGSGWLSQRAL